MFALSLGRKLQILMKKFFIIIFFAQSYHLKDMYYIQCNKRQPKFSHIQLKVKWIPIHFINNQIIKGVRPVIRDVMNVIFLVKVMLFVRISIETPPHHPYFSSSHLCIACEKHLHDSNEILFPLMKTSAAMNEKPTKKKKKKRRKIWENDKNLYVAS